ncbi:MAG: bifunctional metallophosphatase/5'-nucleotidase [Armatimonadetes bacterium]|nr:bifunctional metallophosphatase/5'-nucleotidase [Armatimonadota bacterium]
MTRDLGISLVFTSDEHGHLAGAPAIRKVADDARAENPGRTLLVSSGDVFQGAPESDLEGGRPGLEVLARSGYDVAEVGNHDFDNGLPYLKKWLAEAPYPVLAGNVVEEATGKLLPGAQRAILKDMNGIKLGLVGVVTPETASLTFAENVQGVRFEDPIETVRRAAAELRAQGADVVGVLSHLGGPADRELAQAVDGLDFILGGHTHEFRASPELINGAVVCQPGSYRKAVGKLELELDPRTRRVTGAHHQLIPIDQSSPRADGEVQALVDHYLNKLKQVTETVVSYNGQALEHDNFLDDSLDVVVGRAMNRAAGTEIALFNQKLVRTGLDAGDVTVGELQTIIPFPNTVVRLEMSRERLVEALQHSLDMHDERSLADDGLRVTTSAAADGSHRIEQVAYEDGSPLPERVILATTDFLAQGGLGYFPEAKLLSEHGLVRDALEQELDARMLEAQVPHPDAARLDQYDARDVLPRARE